MSVNILGGHFKGHPLQVPSATTTRPTSILLRRKIFDRFQDCSGKIFIDLCSGSGPMGLEALSRGAEKVLFIESRKEVGQMLNVNIEAMAKKFHQPEIKEQCQVIISDAVSWLQQYLQAPVFNQSNTMLFIDPPYEDHIIYEKLTKLLIQYPFAGDLLIESDVKKGPPQSFWHELPWRLNKCYEQGDHFINWYWPLDPGES